jgi:hypothetical protein
VTGLTDVLEDTAVPMVPGTKVMITFGPMLPSSDQDDDLAQRAIDLAYFGSSYAGPSSPHWYAPADLHGLLLRVVPEDATVADVVGTLGFDLDDSRRARDLTKAEAAQVLDRLRAVSEPVPAGHLGHLGRDAIERAGGYALKMDTVHLFGAALPYVVEAWAVARRSPRKGSGNIEVSLYINRTPTLARLTGYSHSSGVVVKGCGLAYSITGPSAANYDISISVITPYVQITTDGKEPNLSPFSTAIAEAVRKACGQAFRALDKATNGWTIKRAAWHVMADAYMKASGGGTLPANARQIMYAARPEILRLTGKAQLNDEYFTQTLLPDYVNENPTKTADWDVVFDARGHFVEPHTGREVALGTLQVRQYVGLRPHLGPAAAITSNAQFPTVGPQRRFSTILFLEKEGFDPLLRAAGIAERFDIAFMSTKGMRVTAARLLLDSLAPHLEKVLVLHDFDVSGFSIFGTLAKDGRRYGFTNKVPVHDIGLRGEDVKAMGLQYEPATATGNWEAREKTLRAHGATEAEILSLHGHRVELNAMTSNQFIAFLERKLAEHGVRKLIPETEILAQHARRVREQLLAERQIEEIRRKLAEDAQEGDGVPEDLRERVEEKLRQEPYLSWDAAVAQIVRRERSP